MKTEIKIPFWIPVEKILWLPTGIWWKRYWWTAVLGVMAVLIVVLAIALFCCSVEKPAKVTAIAPVSEPAPVSIAPPAQVTHWELIQLLRTTFPGFTREIDRPFYRPVQVDEVRELQENELEVGFYRGNNKGTVEIVLVVVKGDLAIYRIDPFERISLVKGEGIVKFP